MSEKRIQPIHPGEILNEEFLIPLNLSQNKLGADLGVSPRRINEIVQGKRSVTADTALRLSRYFNMSPEFWLALQMDYDLALEQDEKALRIAKEVKIYSRLPTMAKTIGSLKHKIKIKGELFGTGMVWNTES
jgi:addiction module HigA family antidote